jgi:phenylacetic acid degradation operon negative regulatory protein
LLARQRRQDEAMHPTTRAGSQDWQGQWHLVVVTSVGTDPRTRATLRNTMHDKRFGELREGVWMRPDNLELQLDPEVAARVRVLSACDDTPRELAGQLWNLSEWAARGHQLLDEMAGAADIPGRFVVAAAMVRHLLSDPILPDDLLPAQWPGAQLRAAYADFATELAERRGGAQQRDRAQQQVTIQLQEAT